jgi:hypothetical protein
MGKYRNQFSLDSFALVFDVVAAKGDGTAVAPTYIMINIRAINSIPEGTGEPVALRDTGVGNATEWVGFLAAIVVAADINAILADGSSKNWWICMMISCVGPRRWIILASRFERLRKTPVAAALRCCARAPPPFCK